MGAFIAARMEVVRAATGAAPGAAAVTSHGSAARRSNKADGHEVERT